MIRNDSVCPKCGNGKTQDDMVCGPCWQEMNGFDKARMREIMFRQDDCSHTTPCREEQLGAAYVRCPDCWLVFFAAPAPPTPPAPSAPEGVKHDATKARWDLVPWAAMTEVVHVLTHGAAKYAPGNWRKVPDHRRRYLSAALRHMTAWAMGEIRDTESGRPHLAHAVCCLLFLLEREGEKP